IFQLLRTPYFRKQGAVIAEFVSVTANRRMHVEQGSVGVEDIGGVSHGISVRADFTACAARRQPGKAGLMKYTSCPVDARPESIVHSGRNHIKTEFPHDSGN